MKPKILIVEDDPDLLELLSYNIQKEGYQVQTALRGLEAVKLLQEQEFDLVLLDVMLPDHDGFRIAQYIKENPATQNIPVIFITAKDTERDKLRGFNLGADDYITKPFSVRELIARIKAVLRRSGKEGRVFRIKVGGLEIDLEKKEVMLEGQRVDLTPTEFLILATLVENEGKPVSREYIIERVLKRDVYDRTVDVHIKKLREKLGKYGDIIQTVRGFGYKINL